MRLSHARDREKRETMDTDTRILVFSTLDPKLQRVLTTDASRKMWGHPS